MSRVRKLLPLVAGTLVGLSILGLLAGVALYLHIAPTVPPVSVLADDRLQVPLRVYSADGRLLAEYGEQRRIPYAYEQFPERVMQAVLAAEDDRFFEHPGVDWHGLMRAAWKLVTTGERGQGGGTITMQVLRDYVGREKTFTRKFREILFALKIERELTKEQILTLYMNKIFLGNRAYGFGAAAEVYYDRDLHDLSLAQVATLAGLAQLPSRVNPIDNPRRATVRRGYVLRRMLELGYISQEEHDAADLEPIALDPRERRRNADPNAVIEAAYVGEMVRAALFERFGEATYTAGYTVVTTINSRLQQTANLALRRALMDYDQRYGWRGAVDRIDLPDGDDREALEDALEAHPPAGGLKPAVVLSVAGQGATVYLGRDDEAVLAWDALSWAKRAKGNGQLGPEPKQASDVLAPGDIVYLEPRTEGWRLAQLPEVQGALVALNPGDSAVLALIGGFDFGLSKFNRAVQAQRQPGSAFKPFIYSAALEHSLTPASVLNDAPVVFEEGEDAWRPENYTEKFYGPTRLRQALYMSRNLVSIRVLQHMGIQHALDYLPRFGFPAERLPRDFTLALGTLQVSPLELAAGYNVFANGGHRTEPWFIQRVVDPEGKVVLEAEPLLACEACGAEAMRSPLPQAPADGAAAGVPTQSRPAGVRHAERVLSPQNTYLSVDMMRDVIRRGTATRAMELKRGDLAGKTGTANDERDTWFAGFNWAATAVSWVGFDDMRELGAGEAGGKTALPMWMDFMRVALEGVPEQLPRQPPGLVSLRINAETGEPTSADDPEAMFELFPADRVPAAPSRAEERKRADERKREPADDLF
jgi:penicillin-binding protein 1A